MHAINILNLILAGISLVSTSPTPSPFNPSRAHFASEDINKAAPFYDLSAFGVHTGQLPRVYDISTGNFTYLPDASYDMFLEVKAGLRNLTAPAPVAETGGIEKRVCESIHFYVFGSCGAFQTTVNCAESGTCWRDNLNCNWSRIAVFSVTNVYVTFWTSDRCNGDKGSFNPSCNYPGGLEQGCAFKQNYASFRVYPGCHRTYPNDGCSAGSTY